VLDRVFWVNPELISDDPGGAAEADLATDIDRLTTIEVDGATVAIELQRRPAFGGAAEWRFSRATVAEIDRLYGEHGFGWLGDRLPPFFFSVEVAQIRLWQLIAILVLVAVGWLVARALAPQVLRALRAGGRRTSAAWDDALFDALQGPLRLGLLAGFLYLAVPRLHLEGPAAGALDVVWKLLVILSLGWILSRWLDVGLGLIARSARLEVNEVARSFIPVLSRVAKMVIWLLVAVAVLDSVGVQVMGLVAGLGLGGIALAFAAQKTIENLFGSFAIAADQPFRVGDFVKIGGASGTVEDVGLRSTRLRTLGRTMITIPNGSIISSQVENYGTRDRFLFKITIGVLYSTSRAQLELIIDETKKLLLGHPHVYKEVVRVRLESFGDSAVNISVLTWLLADSYNHYTAVVEELNFSILEIVEDAGTGFAFPSRTVYTTREAGVDAALAAEAESVVEARRSSGELWIPEPPESLGPPVDELEDED